MLSSELSDEALDGIDIAESFGFKDPKMQLESSTSPLRKQRYICYECGGDPEKTETCRTCSGTKRVCEGSPMVNFLTNIMNIKLGLEHNRCILENIKMKPQFSEIKEEEGQINCDLCNIQIENEEYMECRECCHYYLCLKCYTTERWEHEHQLSKRRMDELGITNEDGPSQDWKTQNNSEDQVEFDDIEFLKTKKSSKTKPVNDICSLCGAHFQDNIIQICRTCQDRGWTFEVCHKCSSNVKQQHIPNHIMKPSLYRQASNKKSNQESEINIFDSFDDRPRFSGNWIDPGSEPKISQIIPDVLLIKFQEEQSQEEIEADDKDEQVGSRYSSSLVYKKNCEKRMGFFARKESPEKSRQMEMSSRVQVVCDESDSDISEVKHKKEKGLINSEVIESENEFQDFEEEANVESFKFAIKKKSRDSKNKFTFENKAQDIHETQLFSKIVVPILSNVQDDFLQSATPTMIKKISKASSKKSRSVSNSRGKYRRSLSNNSSNSQQSNNDSKRKARVQRTDSKKKQSDSSEDEKFQFCDYLCDYCQKAPKRFRYHCQQCDDYDLCCQCYPKRSSIHPLHDQFIQINKKSEGQVLIKQEEDRKKLLENILKKFGGASRLSECRQSEKPHFRSQIGSSSQYRGTDSSSKHLRMSYW